MVWMDVERNELLFNAAAGRRKPANARDPRVIAFVTYPRFVGFHNEAKYNPTALDAYRKALL